MEEDRLPLLERPGEVKDDDDEDFDPLEETVKKHQDFGLDLETKKTSLGFDKLKEKERNKTKANKIIMKRFPNYNPQKSSFTAIINELGGVSVFLIHQVNAVEYPLLINDEINPNLPTKIIDSLGPQEEVEMSTPKTSTGRETLRPKKFKVKESQWDPVKTPKLKKYITDAMKEIKEKFPNLNLSKLEDFVANINEAGEITVKLGDRSNAAIHPLFDKNGDINEKIPEEIKEILGEQRDIYGLRHQLELTMKKKDHYKKNMKKMEELVKTKDDELKKQDDVIKEKEKEIIRVNELEELIKSKDEIIKSKDDEAAIKVKDVTVIKQMSARDMEEARKEIEKLTIVLNLEREKEINSKKKLEIEKKKIDGLQEKIDSFERERVKMEHDIKEIRESGDAFNQKLAREKEDLLKQLEDSEQLTKDLQDITYHKIVNFNKEVEEAKRLEADAVVRIKLLSDSFAELENRNEVEVAGARRDINKLTSERNNAQRSLEVMKNESRDRFADYDRFIQELEKKINDLEQEKATIKEENRVAREQWGQERAENQEKIRVLNEELERRDIGENVRANIEQNIEVLEERNNEIDAEIERKEEEAEKRISEIDEELDGDPERMTLREKIKSIFKKYGFTVTAILLSISAIVVTIVTNSLSAVSKMATSVANGLKAIGKKLASILPGMIGAIASFIFRTAGEVFGFLAKNAWLLVLAVVFYFVENLKKKNKR